MGKIYFFLYTSRTEFSNLFIFIFLKILGFANSSLYTGDIDYVNMPVKGSYWTLALTCT